MCKNVLVSKRIAAFNLHNIEFDYAWLFNVREADVSECSNHHNYINVYIVEKMYLNSYIMNSSITKHFHHMISINSEDFLFVFLQNISSVYGALYATRKNRRCHAVISVKNVGLDKGFTTVSDGQWISCVKMCAQWGLFCKWETSYIVTSF